MTSADRSGTSIGGYLLEERIGRGGMGVVYRAVRAATGETVALKVMAPEMADSDEFRRRFLLEAEAGPSIDHPHVVAVHESGEAGGELFIAMDFIDGPDLKTLIRNEAPLSANRCLSLLGPIADALDAAHEAGLVHRDVKPQNILIEGDGAREAPYLTDFGLVKPLSSETTTTRAGEVFGSLQYMAPEQIEGLPADGRADVYALGCVAYEALTGRVPFERANEVAVMWAQVNEDPPAASATRPELPLALDVALRRAMSKHPDDRFLTCGELTDALDDTFSRKTRAVVQRRMRPLVARAPRRKTEREVWAPNFFPELQRVRRASTKTHWTKSVAVASALVVVAAALVEFRHEGGLAAAAGDVARSAQSAGRNLVEAVSGSVPEGEQAARSQSRNPLDSRRTSRAISAAKRTEVSRGAARAQARGGAARAAIPPGEPAPMGTIVFARTAYDPVQQGDWAIYTANAGGGGLREVYNQPVARDDYQPAWSPDGEKIAFISGWSLYVMDADGTNARVVASGGWIQQPAWSPDGDKIVFARNPQQSTDAPRAAWDIGVVNADGSDPQTLVDAPGFDQHPSWSPDGERIAFAREAGANRDIYTIAPDGTGLRRITRAASVDMMPDWSPDGSAIAFARSGTGPQAGGVDIYVKRFSTNDVVRITSTGAAFAPSWSPDGKWIVFSDSEYDRYRSGAEEDIYIVRSVAHAVPVGIFGENDTYEADPDWI